jgi:hypothetical protein
MAKYKGVEVGGVYPTSNHGLIEVLSIGSSVSAQVRFVDSGYVAQAELGQIRRGTVKDWSGVAIGQVFPTLNYGKVEIVSYIDSQNLTVKFINTGNLADTTAGNLKQGKVMDYYLPVICGVGYIGKGPYSSTKHPKIYNGWIKMLTRCYENGTGHKNYLDKSVKDNWHDFQNFAAWSVQQVGYDNKGWQLDKDILIKGNTVYSEDTCCYVPARVNSLIIKSDTARGSKADSLGSYYFSVKEASGTSLTKKFKDREEGRAWYVVNKERIIKEVANEYKNVLDSRVYEALYSWQVN